jgi:hypothetical protein
MFDGGQALVPPTDPRTLILPASAQVGGVQTLTNSA